MIQKNVFFALSLIMTSAWGAGVNWKVGETEYKLTKTADNGYLSESCIKSCGLKTKVSQRIGELKNLDFSGGKNPASVFCKTIGAQVIYLTHDKNEEAFCQDQNDIISLSLLLP